MTKLWLNNLLILAVALALPGIPSAQAQGYADLHDFDTPLLASPQYPGLLAQGRDGNIYGTAPLGGTSGRGGVFKITPNGAYSVLVNFDSTRANPYSGLTLGTDGNFYGASFNGGSHLLGTAFMMTPAGVVTTLHDFSYSEGCSPYAPPIQGSDGNFYGTTSTGGAGYGAVYKITPGGVFTSIYIFDNVHGSTPIAALIQAIDGNFYGTTKVGGTSGFGTVFRITPAGVLTVIYNFDSVHGANPYDPVLQGDDGAFYGTARNGGTLNNGGVAFKLTPAGALTVLHNFDATTTMGDGIQPYAGLMQCYCLNLHFNVAYYGVASAGGANGQGMLYDLDGTGNYAPDYSFLQATGSLPFATLRQHTNGYIFGEATSGGAAGQGVIYGYALSFRPSDYAFVISLPSFGRVGDSIGILGTGLSSATSLKFGGMVSAPFTIVSDTYITATVPSGALTNYLTISFPGNHFLHSKERFRVTPAIRNFSPGSGPVGAPVVIKGTSFTGATRVSFGGVKATVFSVDSYGQITATVPEGAQSGKIQVATPGGTANSPKSFEVSQ